MHIRKPLPSELQPLSDLCMRSKAVWGYDREFMDACRAELTLNEQELDTTMLALAEDGERIAGVVQVGMEAGEADLLKLFVDPQHLRKGIGRQLLSWAIDQARSAGAHRLIIEADPGAVPFYLGMGARQIGLAPSGSIPGRTLPKLALDL